MLRTMLACLLLQHVAGFSSVPGVPDTEALVTTAIEELNSLYHDLGEDEVAPNANRVLKEVTEINALLTDMLARKDGLTVWKETAAPVDVDFEKFMSYDYPSHTAAHAVPLEAKMYELYNPSAASYLYRNGDMTLVREMIAFPNTSNLPEDVSFDLPANVNYSTPSDLYFMTIAEMASLIKEQTVSCKTVVDAFIARLEEFDGYLAYMTYPLFDKARSLAESHDELIASGTYLGPLMCIPFGMKDHHQIDDEPTSYGNILFAKNVQSIKSTVASKLLAYGAIPLAKLTMGSLAWGNVHGWGSTISPYLNGGSGGSSTGSGSAASLRALPFAISEETWGSIASPAAANLVSGHIGSYGTISRAGAGLLSSETDHLGFHSRYLSDFGIIMNYLRTGKDEGDGDTVDYTFVDPAKVDVSKLKVLIITGEGEWVQDEETGSWSFDGTTTNSYSKTAWKWPERVELIKEAFDSAGVEYDAYNISVVQTLFEDYSLDPLFPDPDSPGSLVDLDAQVGGGAWFFFQNAEIVLENSRFKNRGNEYRPYPKNVPKHTYTAQQFGISHFGKKFLNDPFWSQYDAVISTAGGNIPGYQALNGNFEQWVRTSKTFVVDYMRETPCAHTTGGTINGAMLTITSLPWHDHINFAIGTLIQEFPKIKANLQARPNEAAIKAALKDRQRCPYEFFENFQVEAECPPANSDGAGPTPFSPSVGNPCSNSSSQWHLPTAWAQEKYSGPYLMDDPMPDHAIFKFEHYADRICEAVCPFSPSYCDFKGITCARRRAKSRTPAKFLKDGTPAHNKLPDDEFWADAN